MKKACLLTFLQFFLPFIVYAFLLAPKFPFPVGIIIGIFPSALMTVALGIFWQGWSKYQDSVLVRDPKAQKKDGKRAAVAGRIYSYGPPMVTPTGADSVCCQWGVFHWVRQQKGGPTKSYLGNGHLLNLSCIRNSMGDVRLLGFPKMEGFPMEEFPLLEGESIKRNQAVAYLQALAKREPYTIADFQKAYREVMELRSDSDGMVQSEYRQFDFETITVKLYYEEQSVPPGAEVCALGRWDASQNGIVPEDISSGKEVIVQKGSRDQVATQLRSSFIKKTIGALVLALVVNSVVWLIVAKMPPQQ